MLAALLRSEQLFGYSTVLVAVCTTSHFPLYLPNLRYMFQVMWLMARATSGIVLWILA